MSSFSTSLLRLLALCALTLPLAGGCARYRTQHASIESAATAPTRAALPTGPLTFEEAVRLLVQRHPELRATRAEIAAVNTNPGPRPVTAGSKIADGSVTETMLDMDVLSLLGLGPRKAQRALARAVRSEAVCAHHERARELVAELAEAYAVDGALRALEAPAFPVDIAAFESAGLASKSVLAAARSVVAEGATEGSLIDIARRDTRRAIARLVAAAPDAAIEPVPVAADWPALTEPERQRLLLARGDLQRLLAAWCVADQTYRYHVARQYPNLLLGLGANVDLQIPVQLIRLELPLDAPAAARAAAHGRDAAFHRLDAGVLNALHDAAAARLDLEAADARLAGAAERRKAAAALLRAERAHLDTDSQGLAPVVLVAGRLVDAARQYREAAVLRARAQIRAARAAGWPTPAMLGGDR